LPGTKAPTYSVPPLSVTKEKNMASTIGYTARRSPANVLTDRLRLGSGGGGGGGGNSNNSSGKKFSRRSLDSSTFNNNRFVGFNQ
jgi:hypothetical protein